MSDSEDDYMKMTFPDPTTKSQPETSLQRRQRERREAEARGRVKSKAELAAEADSRREAALSRSLLDSASPSTSTSRTGTAVAPSKASKGLAMMAKMGFKGGALGKQREDGVDDRVVEPIRISVKDGREGIGLESERKRKLREAAEAVEEQAKKARVDEGEYRDRVRREREEARLERQVAAAQKVAERMDDAEVDIASRPLRSVPLMYRSLVKMRAEAERERRMRKDLEQSLPRLPTYDDPEEDEDDKRALGRGQAEAATTYIAADDLDEEDTELEEFNSLPPEDRLQRLVEYLRAEHKYCFWCKFAYPDAEMGGCPGLTEEDHD